MRKSETILSVVMGAVCGCLIAGAGFAAYSIRENTGSRYWYRAVEASPNNPTDFVLLGLALEDEANYADAEKAFERAHALNSRKLSPIMELGNLAERRGDHLLAIRYWQQIADQTSGATTNEGRRWHAKANGKLVTISR